MAGFVLKFLISFLISNWCYSEAVLILPGFDTFVKTVYEQIKLPTHNEWPEIGAGAGVPDLERSVDAGAAKLQREGSSLLATLFSADVKSLWRSERVPVASDSNRPGRVPFVVDDAAFGGEKKF